MTSESISCADDCELVSSSRCSRFSGVAYNSSLIPITPLSGVRISCDIVERKRVFSRFAASAAARAFWMRVSSVET